MRTCRWHQRCLENEEDSARSLAARITGYLSRTSMQGGANDRCWPTPDLTRCPLHVRFSNRPFGVKRFQTIRHLSVNVARGLVLLFGIGTKALPSWDSKTRWNNLPGGLAVSLTGGPSGHAISPHPSSREGHHSTARWSSSFLLSDLILHGFMLLPWPVPGSIGTRCRQPICGVGSQRADAPAPRLPSSSRGVWRSASPRP